MTNLDKRELRQALGQYMTGVTIVTTIDDEKKPVGVTANSFSSVSLEPPLVLWALSRHAKSIHAFQNSDYFCIHVLTAEQQDLAERFARSGEDKFAGLEWCRGLGSAPLLPDYVAQFQCSTVDQHIVGDHIVFFGKVLRYDKTNKRPLVFHAGRYSLGERRSVSKNRDSGIGYSNAYGPERRARTSTQGETDS